MIRISTFLFAVCPLFLHAQQNRSALPLHPEVKDGYRAPARLQPFSGGERGSAFYTEAFDNDLNGWTTETPLGIVEWKWTSTGPGPTSSTYPVPILNTSTPSGWAIIDDDYDGVSGQSTNASLISPVIDLSSAPANLKVEFDQYFQEFQLDHTYVGVSTDGGVTWNEVEINEGVGRDGRPNPELVDVNISAWVADNPSNVQLRFRYESTWDYGWQIDNIAIRELPNNDMALIRATTTAYDFDNTGFDFMDYSIYPVSQLALLEPRATIKNKGFDPQTGVSVNLLVEGPSGTVVDASTAAGNYDPGVENIVTLADFTPASEPGLYTITYSVDQDQDDQLPLNNTIVNTLTVSTNVYGHDDGVVDNFQVEAPSNEGEPYEVGNYFVLLQEAYAMGVQVAIHEDTPVGGTVYGAVYLPAADDASHPDLLDLTTGHIITESDLNPIGGSNFVTMTFASPFLLDAAQPYLVVAGSFDGPDDIHFATSGVSAAQVSNIHYPNLSESFQFYITKTPMVRLLISDGVGISALDVNDTEGLSAFPNPMQDQATLLFELKAPALVGLTISDATGRLVLERSLGLRAAGEHRHDLDGSALAPGTYTCTLRIGEQRISRRLVIAR